MSLLEPDTKNGGIDKSTTDYWKKHIVWRRADKIFKSTELTVLPKDGQPI